MCKSINFNNSKKYGEKKTFYFSFSHYLTQNTRLFCLRAKKNQEVFEFKRQKRNLGYFSTSNSTSINTAVAVLRVKAVNQIIFELYFCRGKDFIRSDSKYYDFIMLREIACNNVCVSVRTQFPCNGPGETTFCYFLYFLRLFIKRLFFDFVFY